MKQVIRSYTLDQDTVSVLLELQRYLGVPYSQVVRWAIAHYADTGPWHAGPEQDRHAALNYPPPLPCGPTYTRRVTS